MSFTSRDEDTPTSGYGEHLRFSMDFHNGRQSEASSTKRYSEENSQSIAGKENRSSNQYSYGRHSRDGLNSQKNSSGCGKPSRGGSTSNKQSYESSSRSNRHSREAHKNKIDPVDVESTIALFGSSGITGQHFLKLALDAGYHVRALVLPGIEMEDMVGNPNLTLVTGTLDDEGKIHRVVRKAAFVVCMLNDCDSTLKEDETQPSNLSFMQRLVPLVGECDACKLVMYQASAYALDTTGATPMFSSMIKTLAVRKTRREALKEQDKIVKYICSEAASTDAFKFIVTRPSDMIWDKPSRKKLAASKSLPGPFPITNVDLAEFSLSALKSKKLYNSCPYVVQD